MLQVLVLMDHHQTQKYVIWNVNEYVSDVLFENCEIWQILNTFTKLSSH